ncbi:MAG: xanthine dehydrogenase [Deltaproteobacteria bacterium]|nr:MAG: xanthine dehydrogenase [Deltaproteobacteria bacterium]
MSRRHYDAVDHVRGTSQYIDDVPPPVGTLYATVVGSPQAKGSIRAIETAEARALPGVHAILRARDIPGQNQIGALLPDEELLASTEVAYIGHPVAVVVAESQELARRAAALVQVQVDPEPPIVDPREAFERGELIAPARTFACGDIDQGFSKADVVLRGTCEIAGQEHLYLETQRARAVPQEGGAIRVASSTQSPYAVQKAVARVLGLPNHRVEVDVRRLGGGFGGKEDQATAWACVAALAAHQLDRPVQIVLHRLEDLQMTGKRHPYSADYEIGLSSDGTILAYRAVLYQNSGARADLSTAVLERSLFHATNAYRVPNVQVTAACCRTNLQPHTAFRGFGGPQGMFVIEAALAHASDHLGIPRHVIQRRNLIREGDVTPYGQPMVRARGERCFDELAEAFDLEGMVSSVKAHNDQRGPTRRGLAVMPICFGISFTKTFLNQAGALLHVYGDGSVGLSTGGVEMGQGVNSKLRDIASQALGIRGERVRLESTNTTRVANMSPSAASATTDLNGNATLEAVRQVRGRLLALAAERLGAEVSRVDLIDEVVTLDGSPTDWSWTRLVSEAYFARVDLSAHGFYATPDLNFDTNTETGNPFAYHVWGASVFVAEVDVRRGTYTFEPICVVHDLGRSINPVVDIGQIEGGLAQGIGWMTLEELAYDDQGRLLSRALSTYKAPDGDFMPEVRARLIEDDNPGMPYGSKAVGEPPLMYGIGAYFALREAVRAFNPTARLPFHAPMTPERVLMGLYETEDPEDR